MPQPMMRQEYIHGSNVVQFVPKEQHFDEQPELESIENIDEEIRKSKARTKELEKKKKQREGKLKPAQPRKDGQKKNTHSNKVSGDKSEVYCLQIPDMKNIRSYFIEHEMWPQFLAFSLSCNLARRAGDILALTWDKIYDEKTGKFKEKIGVQEQKTKKYAEPYCTKAVRNAVNLYLEKTGIVPSDDYKVSVFIQMTGTYKGRPMSYGGYMKSLKRAAADLGIEYNIGTHSPRKTFGYISKMLHPNDHNSMEIIQEMFNHSDAKTTNNYIGITDMNMKGYYDDFSNTWEDYVIGDKVFDARNNSVMVTLEMSELSRILNEAYNMGRANHDEDVVVHMDAISRLNLMVEEARK